MAKCRRCQANSEARVQQRINHGLASKPLLTLFLAWRGAVSRREAWRLQASGLRLLVASPQLEQPRHMVHMVRVIKGAG